jgi:transposase
MIKGMKALYVRELTEEERKVLEKGLRSSSGFTVRRCQILLTSAEEKLKAREIAVRLHVSDQCVRNAIHAFHEEGIGSLKEKSHRPHKTRASFDGAGLKRLAAIAHASPRDFGQESSVWTLARLAEACHAEKVTSKRVGTETIRRAFKQMGLNWKRAKRWIQSPDPQYEVKKNCVTS